jgi:hypothetical protein
MHSGTQALHKTGKTRSATANHCCVEGLVWRYASYAGCSAPTRYKPDGIAITIGNDVIAPLRCEEFTLFRTEIATGAGMGTPTNDCRNNVLRTRERAHALNHGGAFD